MDRALGRDGRMPWFGVAKEILNWPADRLKPVQGSVHRVSTAVLDAEMAQGTSARIEAGLMAKEYRDAVAQADAAMAELLVNPVLQPLCISLQIDWIQDSNIGYWRYHHISRKE